MIDLNRLYNRFLVCTFAFLLLPCMALAHGGRTDKNGGHTNHSTGEYHYHHGYPAHQHVDGVCQYDPNYQPGIVTEKEYTEVASNDGISSSDNIFNTPYPYVVGIIPIGCAYAYARKKKNEKEEQRRLQQEHHDKLVAQYSLVSLREVSRMPMDTEIGIDGLPKLKESYDWGDFYTRYTDAAQATIHSKECHFAKHKFHVFGMPQSQIEGMSMCPLCNPTPIPDREWFDIYQKAKAQCEREGVTPLPDDQTIVPRLVV